jgi:membrane protein implicated in regulation of membrane protease activity
MDIIEYFSSNHANLLFLIAGITLVLELAVMGLSGLLLFFSIGCFITAILTHFGIISGWESEVFSVGLWTCIAALLLYKPLKNFQSREVPPDNSSDMTGREVVCAESVTRTQGAIRYSGINWPARLASTVEIAEINEGELCVITNVDGNIMIVQPLDD